MRILCPLQIYYHQDGLIWGLRKAGHEVRVLDGMPIQREQLARTVEEFRPDLLFSFGWWKGHLHVEDLAWIAARYHIPHVCWASDDPTHHKEISLPLARCADLVFTTTEELIPTYHAMGKKAYYLQFACNPQLHLRVNGSNAERHDIVLVANNYSIYDFMRMTYRSCCMETMIKPLVKAGLDLMVYGGNWDNVQSPFHIPPYHAGPDVPYHRLAEIYSSAKIVLGLQTECHSRTQTSCRLFEVLGCRAFHLAPATRSMTSLFMPGRHLAVSRVPDETAALARYYLTHGDERERIAAAGQLEVYRNHTYLHRADDFVRVVTEEL